MTLPKGFSQARFDELRRLWDEGVPWRDMCQQLGVTKGVVAGIAHRWKFPRRRSSSGPQPAAASPSHPPAAPQCADAPAMDRPLTSASPAVATIAAPQLSPPPPSPPSIAPSCLDFGAETQGRDMSSSPSLSAPPPAPPPPPAPAPPRRLDRAPKECCWPIGEPRSCGFRFCGDPSEPGKPYCTAHLLRARVPRAASPGTAASEARA